jgi:hypothetical protein
MNEYMNTARTPYSVACPFQSKKAKKKERMKKKMKKGGVMVN